jgi:stage II sporulation protein D
VTARSRASVALAATSALVGASLLGCGRGHGFVLAGQQVPLVRVVLGKAAPSATVRVAGRWEITGGGGTFRASGTDLATSFSARGDGVVLGARATGVDEVRLRASGPFSVEGVFASAPGTRSYLGSLVVRRQAASVVLVNEVDLETYVAGVVANELGPGAAPAAYRAQAVAARAYAYVKVASTAADVPFHVQDTESSQVYRGLHIPEDAGVTLEDVRRRVAETRGVVLTWRSQPFPTYYASTCGGHTTDAATSRLDPGGATEPLSGVPCRFCAGSKYFEWTTTVTEATLLRTLAPRGVGAPITAVEVTKLGRGGWVAEVTVAHGPKASKKRMSGVDFRYAASLRSSKITGVQPVAGGWQVTGAGWGHGVGMCQVGAMEMARRGLSDTDILRYYYPGAEISRLY